MYKSCISKAKTASVKVELTVKFSRFLRLVLMDNESAKTILQNLLEETEAKNQAKIYMQLLDIELHSLPLKQSSVLEILDRAISSKSGLPSKQRLIFSQRKIEFLEDFGSKIEEIKGKQSLFIHVIHGSPKWPKLEKKNFFCNIP